MPYKSVDELHDSVRENLPRHAQEIFQATFNSAWTEYNQDEERAFRVAWAAVKDKYEKDKVSGKWKPK
jgi:cation transport regulator